LNYIVAKLLHWLMFAGTMFLAAGAIADAGEGAPDAGVIADNAVTEPTVGDTGDTGDDAAGGEPSSEGDAIPEPAGVGGEQDKLDARTLPADVRAHLAELRTAGNAAVADKIGAAFAKQANFYKEFPGGMKEAREFKSMVTELGGKEGLQTFEQEKAEWRDIDERWAKADPSFVDGMIESNPDSFVKIAPHAMNKWAEVDSPGYDHYASGIMMVTLRDSGVLNDLYLAKQLIGLNNPAEAGKILDKIQSWIGNLDKISKTQPAARAKTTAAPDERETRIQQQETQLFDREVGISVEPKGDALMAKELRPFLKGTEMNDRTKAVFKREVMAELRTIADKDANFKTNFERLYAARDKAGIDRLTMSMYGQHMAAVVKKVHGELFRTTSFAGQKKPVAAKLAADTSKPVQGWVKVAARPNPQDLNSSKTGTTYEMIRAGGAILKDGRKVFWGEKPPAA
jgi:hypothetical protein